LGINNAEKVIFVQVKKIVVVGAGPAGLMAAISSSQLGQDVTIVEKNSFPGRKLLLSGKGRCNITNAADIDSFISRFSHGGEFLRDAHRKFSNLDLISFFKTRGLELKTERQLRVFPVSDKSSSVLDCLLKEIQKNNVKLITKSSVKDILVENNQVKGVSLADKSVIYADRIILATGGASYAFTGSTGEGMNIAAKLGHKIIPLRPGLVPLKTKQSFPKLLEGLTLKNIRLKFCDGKKQIISEVGELVFTSFGISGPLVLSLSSKITDWLNEGRPVCVEIDLKPALNEARLELRLLREFKLHAKKSLKNVLKALLPMRLIEVFIAIAEIPSEKQTSQITHRERLKIIKLLKGFRLDIAGALPIEEAMITKGGVSLKDINPRTMESRLVKGMYFAGEIIDVDADTGGFNLQAAFSTGYLAGKSAASKK